MIWKPLLTTVALSSLILSACGTNDDTARMNQDTANLRTVSDNNRSDINRNTGNDNITGNNTTDNQDNGFTTRNVNNNQNRDITARNIADNTADNDRNGNTINNRNNRMEVADQAAEKIAQMREVDRTNVILTDENAYVAVKLADNAGKKLTVNVEKRISEIVKATYRGIDHVYVSVNPDFYKRTTSYAEDIRDGRPVEGFFDEFGEAVRRAFPTER